MATAQHLLTADDLWSLPRDGRRHRLVAGELQTMSPAGPDHGRYAIHLSAPLAMHVLRHRLGAVYAAETGFRLARNPDTVQAPDIAYVRKGRVRPLGATGEGYFEGPPDLAVEVLAPGDRPKQAPEKIATWLAHATSLVILIDARRGRVTLHRPDGEERALGPGDSLPIDVFEPAFTIPVAELFSEEPDL